MICEGFVIVSADGMLTDASGQMPASLRYDADQAFFSDALDRVDVVVHGRHSFEDQPHSPRRARVRITRAVEALGPDDTLPNSIAWNPHGASFEAACNTARPGAQNIAIIGGPGVFAMLLPRISTFWLSQARRIQLPGGQRAIASPDHAMPQDVLMRHGFAAQEPRILDAAQDVIVTPWRRL